MKRFLIILSICLFCLTQAKVNAMGIFYTDATYPVTATGAEIKDLSKLKKAEVSTTTILFLFEKGNAGIDQAIAEAEISKISHIDVREKSIFIFWRKLTVQVYGE
jgi:hypothetical protein